MKNLSKEEQLELINLNSRLQLLQEKIIIEAIKIDLNLSNRVKNNDDVLYDYELELEIKFLLKEDDINYEENEDNILTKIDDYLKGVSRKLDNYPYGSKYNHLDIGISDTNIINHHCWWFHCLYDHNALSFKDMARIGKIWSDIKVTYQYYD